MQLHTYVETAFGHIAGTVLTNALQFDTLFVFSYETKKLVQISKLYQPNVSIELDGILLI